MLQGLEHVVDGGLGMQTRNWTDLHGTLETLAESHAKLVKKMRTLGASMTWLETWPNGALTVMWQPSITGMGSNRPSRRTMRKGYYVVVLGTWNPTRHAVRRGTVRSVQQRRMVLDSASLGKLKTTDPYPAVAHQWSAPRAHVPDRSTIRAPNPPVAIS
jgi:hypothetical protein